MRILLLCSAFNGLSQRAWIQLREDGHDVTVELAVNADAIVSAVGVVDPDLIICPFLRERIPADVWTRYRTIVIHPGPTGDRVPSSLDWAITDGVDKWGVTALQAIEEMDAGPIWGTREVPVESTARKSDLYNGPVADAAAALIREVVAKAADPTFVPEPLDYRRPDVTGRLRPSMRQSDRQFSWSDSTAHILRRIRAADGAPGARATLCDASVAVFDAHPGPALDGKPGTIALRRHGAVLVRSGDGGVWVGHVRRDDPATTRAVKLPATIALGDRLAGVPEVLDPALTALPVPVGYHEISYQRIEAVGLLTFDFYNGAMSTSQCRRLAAAIREAAAQDTKVLVLRGGQVFSNGIHLNIIEAAPSPALEAWRNINAIDDVCREIITCSNQLVVVSMGGNAGAGGVMLALGADRVIARDGVVINPHYRTMGLSGSEYWTYVLPRRVGTRQAESLTEQCLPIGAGHAARIGLVDEVLSGQPTDFEDAVSRYAARLVASGECDHLLELKRTARAVDEGRKPLEAYRIEELAEMSREIFDDRHGFADARHAFVTKTKPSSTPSRIARHRPVGPSPDHRTVQTELAG